MIKPNKVAFIVGLTCSVSVLTAHAGGLYLQEFGTPAMGTANTGANVLASDASTVFHNPAGMTYLDSNQFMLAGGLLYYDIQFEPDASTPIPGNDGGSAGDWAPLLSVHYARQINEEFWLGIANYTLSAAVLDYNDDWAGRFQGQEVNVFTSNLLVSGGYKFSDTLSLGAGFTVLYGKIEQDVAVPPNGSLNIDADGFGFGFLASMLWEPVQDTRFGLVYASELEPDLEGDVTIDPPGASAGSTVDIVFPETIRSSVLHKLNDKWTLLGSLNWERWSKFESLTLNVNDGPTVPLARNWRDIYIYGAGVHYQWDKDWILKSGIAYTESPVSASDRTADMPIDREIRYAIGFEHELSEEKTLAVNLVYMDRGDAEIYDENLLIGEYKDNQMLLLGASLNWK